MKNLQLKILTIFLLSLGLPLLSIGQGVDTAFSVHGNTLNTSNFIGSSNNRDLLFKTNNSTRMIISKDGNVNINTNLLVPGYINADSLHVRVIASDSIPFKGAAIFDSIKTQVLDVGDSSIRIGSIAGQNADVVGTDLTTRSISLGHTNAGVTFVNGAFHGVNIGTTTTAGFKLHIHDDNTAGNAYVQFTNSGVTGGGTGQTASDGFLVGITTSNTTSLNGSANLIQRGAKRINFLTANTQRMTLTGSNTISAIGGDNTGYVGIGTLDPLTMLHVGDGSSFSGTNHGGWRTWMKNGLYVDYDSDNLYLGMKDEGSNLKDAILAWGDDLSPSAGPDNLRFIFNEFGGSTNGIEAMRLMPYNESGSYVSINAGIGNYYTGSIIPPMRRLEVLDGTPGSNLDRPQFRLTYTQNADVTKGIYTDFETMSNGNLYITPANSTHDPLVYGDYKRVGIDWPKIGGSFNSGIALDVNGEEDLRTVENKDSLARVLVWDYSNSTEPGNIKWRRASTLGVAGAQNGAWIEPGGKVELGTNPLLHNTDIPLLGYNLSIDNADVGGDVGIGLNPVGSGRLQVYSHDNANTPIGIQVKCDNGSVGDIGIQSFASSPIASVNAGIYALAISSASGAVSYGANFSGFGPGTNVGMVAGAGQGIYSYGIECSASGASINDYGIFSGVNGTNPQDYAGYFNGDVLSTSGNYLTSDSIFKNYVNDFSGDSALIILKSLKPKTYYFNREAYPSFTFPSSRQYGLISEQVENVLPNLVKRSIQPPKIDSLGSILYDSVSYKALNYNELIPILVAGEKQLDSLQNALPNKLNNGLSADTTTHMLQWGGSCLRHNTEIPMRDTTGGIDSARNIYFSGQNHISSADLGNIGIGYNKGDYIGAKLGVVDSIYPGFAPRTGGLFHTTGSSIYGFTNYAGITSISDVNTGGVSQNVGGEFHANNSSFGNIGVLSIAGDETHAGFGFQSVTSGYLSVSLWGNSNGSANNYGANLYVGGGSYVNIGVSSSVYPVSGASNIAVYGDIGSSGSTAPDYAGYFNGDVYTTGSYLPSDSKLKTDIRNVSSADALKVIDALQPKTYSYNTKQFPTMALPTEQQYGLVSEDVEKILPTLVKDSKTPPKIDSTGKVINPSIEFKALNYTGLVPILIAATKQLDSTNHAQQSEIDSLQAQLVQMNTAIQQLQNCCQQNTNSQPQDRQETVVLSNSNAIILDQNAPNPFAEQTTIKYTIPESVSNAEIIFSDNNGQVIKTVQIQARGVGSLLVYASNLSSGIYTYSLIADGKLIDTKKMTVQK